MKECWVTEPLHFEMRETEIPEPKDNEVQIKMMAAGVCGSDIHIYKGENPNSRYPLIPRPRECWSGHQSWRRLQKHQGGRPRRD